MKTVLITGIGKGIGKALAQKFSSEDYFVVGTSTTGEVDYSFPQLAVYKLDLSLPESIAACAEEIIKTGKKNDIHINNAGILADDEETAVVAAKLRQTLEVNLIGTIDFTERLLSAMSDGGHIINISSTAGSLALTGSSSHFLGHYPAYRISKSALNMYTKTLALKHESKLIVSAVHPGWVKTDMGGEDADVVSDPRHRGEAAKNIFDFAITRPETGGFWFNGERLPW